MSLIDKVRDKEFATGMAIIRGWAMARLLEADIDAYREMDKAEELVYDQDRERHEKEMARLKAERKEILASMGRTE